MCTNDQVEYELIELIKKSQLKKFANYPDLENQERRVLDGRKKSVALQISNSTEISRKFSNSLNLNTCLGMEKTIRLKCKLQVD